MWQKVILGRKNPWKQCSLPEPSKRGMKKHNPKKKKTKNLAPIKLQPLMDVDPKKGPFLQNPPKNAPKIPYVWLSQESTSSSTTSRRDWLERNSWKGKAGPSSKPSFLEVRGSLATLPIGHLRPYPLKTRNTVTCDPTSFYCAHHTKLHLVTCDPTHHY